MTAVAGAVQRPGGPEGPSTTSPGSRARSTRRVGWGLADQALSSLTNFVVGIVVARTVSLEEFGAFALVFATYSIVLSLSRALTTEPLVVRHSHTDDAPDRAAESHATGAALGFGIVSALACLAVVPLLPGQYRPMLIALAIMLPPLLLQDAWRVVFFVRGKGRSACLNDAVWALALPVTFLLARQNPTAATMTLAWGAAGCVAAWFGIRQSGIRPSLRSAWSWIRGNWDLSSRYATEALILTGTQQAYFFVIGAVAGLGAVGSLRLVMVVLGPVNIVIQGVGMAALPEVVRAAHTSRRRLWQAVLGVSAIVSLGALLWGAAILLAPTAWLEKLAGTSWTSAAALVLPMMLLQVLNGVNTGAYMGIRAMRRVNRGLALRVLASINYFLGATIGAFVAGASGAAWGLVVAALINDVAWWLGYFASQRTWWASHTSPATS